MVAVLITERFAASLGTTLRAGAEEAFVVAIVAVGVFVWPLANRGIPHSATVLALVLAVLVQAAWAIRRFPPTTASSPQPWRDRAKKGARVGLSYAAVFGVVVIVLFLLGSDTAYGPLALPVILSVYCVGGLLIGVIGGLARHLARWPLGAMLVGVTAALTAFGMLFLALPVIKPRDSALPVLAQLGLAGAAALLIGPVAGLIVRAQWSRVA
jgi:hypothetical protein